MTRTTPCCGRIVTDSLSWQRVLQVQAKARVDGIHQLQIRGSSAMPETRPLPTVARFQKRCAAVMKAWCGLQMVISNDFVLQTAAESHAATALTLAAGESLSVPVRLSSAGIVRLYVMTRLLLSRRCGPKRALGSTWRLETT